MTYRYVPESGSHCRLNKHGAVQPSTLITVVNAVSRPGRLIVRRLISLSVTMALAVVIVSVVAIDRTAVAQSADDSSRITVVRAWFDNREMVNELARDYAPWEVLHDHGYLVIGVTDAQRQDIESRGFRVEVDTQLTEYYSATPATTSLPGIPGFPCYRTVEETFDTARALVASNPRLASWIDIGDSWDKTNGRGGYDLMVLKLTNADVAGPKPVLFQMTAVHAREYTTAELNTRFAEYLINNYGTDADVTWLLDHHEFHLLLQANPDGRKLAEAGVLWRKNVNQNACLANPNQRGIDLNRNFPFNWGCCGGSSSNQCSLTYRGSSGNSEVETKAITDYLKTIFQDRRPQNPDSPAPADTPGIFLDTHSFSELVLWPWGYTENPTANGAAMAALGRKLARFNGYRPTQVPGLYIVDGGTMDYSYGELGVASYSFELGTSFFQDCPTFERRILPDNLDALIYAAKVARAPYILGQGPDAINLSLSSDSVRRGEPVTIRATLDDTRYNNSNGVTPTQNISAAQAFVDTPPWANGARALNMTASDGRFDERVEPVSVQIDTSSLSQGRHTVFVRGRDASGNWGAVSAKFVTIEGGGGSDPTLSASDVTVNENSGNASVRIRLSDASSETVRVTAYTRAGTARGGSDYYGDTKTLTFAPGVTSQVVNVTLVNDQINEATESFQVILVNPVNATIADSNGVVTINDDDTGGGGSRLSIRSLSVDEGVGTARVSVSLNQPAATTVSVLAFTQTLTATPGQDFYGATTRLQFSPGQTVSRFDLFILDDARAESSETVRLRLTDARGGGAVIADGSAVLTITDNDSGGGPARLNASSATVNESVGTATVRLTLSRAVNNATVSAEVFTQSGSARGGSDYYGFSRRVFFAPGVTQQTVSIPIINDTAREPTEQFAVRFNSLTNAVAGSSATVTINDND